MAVNLAAVTTLRRVQLYQGQPGTGATTLYTVPASTDAKITEILLCNTTGSAATITISVVPTGGSASAANRILSAMQLVPNETVVFTVDTYLTTGTFLSALQGTASAITVTISGETYA